MPPGSQALLDLLPTGRFSWTVVVVSAVCAVVILLIRTPAERDGND